MHGFSLEHLRRFGWRFWVVLALITIGLAVAIGLSRGPFYGGRSLGSWLRLLHNPKSSFAEQQIAQSALRAMGTNLFPALLRGMDKPESGFLVPFVGLVDRLGLHYQLPMHLAWSRAGLLRLSLGSLDAPTRQAAVPVLFDAYVDERLHGRSPDQRRQLNLANALFDCGNAFPPFLAGALTNAQPATREQAASLVGFRKDMSTQFIGALAERLTDPAPGVRWQAIWSLARFRKEPVVPLLARGLQDRDASVRRAAIECLQRFGPLAKPALPDLLRLAEQDPPNRQPILDCLHAIDSAEAERIAAKFKN